MTRWLGAILAVIVRAINKIVDNLVRSARLGRARFSERAAWGHYERISCCSPGSLQSRDDGPGMAGLADDIKRMQEVLQNTVSWDVMDTVAEAEAATAAERERNS